MVQAIGNNFCPMFLTNAYCENVSEIKIQGLIYRRINMKLKIKEHYLLYPIDESQGPFAAKVAGVVKTPFARRLDEGLMLGYLIASLR
ncbi:hypothetical protein EPI10_002572 [Gossypium australe]|uniref:Uncharacterized protein n=1 Tax=Gossypium australe TaxID=47621 RepID=A0A5B6VEC1_9ROSI|nr:hypothetical protein EPI10_002572 [Gossypium australe]